MLNPGLACLLSALSGLASLSWQAVWLPRLSVGLGHEFVATLGLTAGVLAGLSLGAWAVGALVERSPRPLLWFAAFEALCGLWGLGVASFVPAGMPWIAGLLGESPSTWAQGAMALGVPMILLAPSTVVMGATVPALVSAVGQGRMDAVRPLPALYAFNTAGAVIGIAVSGPLLLPALGADRVGFLAALLNAACALIATGTGLRHQEKFESSISAKIAVSPCKPAAVPRNESSSTGAILLLASTGFLSIGFETVCLRALSEFHENTALSYAMVLGIFLLGNAAGAALHSQGRAASGQPSGSLLSCSIAVLFGAAALFTLPLWGVGAGLMDELRRAAVVLIPGAVATGLALAACCEWAQDCGLTAAQSLGINTLAAAVAPAIVGLLGIPLIGMAATVVLIGMSYGCLAALAQHGPRRRLGLFLGLPLTVGAAWAVPPMPSAAPVPGEVTRWRGEGLMATVTITEDEQSILRLRINNRTQEGSSAFSPIEARLGAIPVLLHPKPKAVLFLGLGTGHTAYTAALDPALEVDAVELIEEVEKASGLFMGMERAPRPAHAPRLVVADARRYVLATGRHYDVIVADLYHPARSGSASLYTVEHYQALRDRLQTGGIVVQWLALHQMEVNTLGSIVAAFKAVFPGGMALLAGNSLDTPVIGLIDRPGVPLVNLARLAKRMNDASPEVQRMMERADVRDAHAVLGSLWIGPSALTDWSVAFQPNRDAWPVTNQLAVRDAYQPRTTSRERLGVLLQAFSDSASAMPFSELEAMSSADSASLQAYWQARHLYLELGLKRAASLWERSLREQLERSLENIIAMSPEFTPAGQALNSLRQPNQP